MSREKMITRTIEGVAVEVLGITKGTEVGTAKFNFFGAFKNDNEILNKVKEVVSEEHFIPVKVVSIVKTEKLFGMTESIFIAYAKELPPRTQAK